MPLTYPPMPRVAAVRHVREHVLWLRFSDGVEGEVDLADALRGELFEPLRDPAAFARVGIEYGTLSWPTGADWAPEELYDRLSARKGAAPRRNRLVMKTSTTVLRSGMPTISVFYDVMIRMHWATMRRLISTPCTANKTRRSRSGPFERSAAQSRAGPSH